jgi:SAM-dependent methyltransferase
MTTEVNAYDEFPYPPYSFPDTHIGRLAAIGRLFGLMTADPGGARVLELGCGRGTNLLAMAQAYPDAEFLGVDYSASHIRAANETLAATGLPNARFLCEDISKWQVEEAGFDYIVAHGVYSWIPAETREALLRTARRALGPGGVALVSYNCLPGWGMRGALRDMMLLHTAGIADVRTKVSQSRALLKFLAEASTGDAVYGKYLGVELEKFSKVDDSYIAHDFLENENRAFYFIDFLKAADRHGLAYLSEATPGSMMSENLPQNAARTLQSLKLNQVAMEQYMDFVRNRTFRSTLLCRAENKPDRNIGYERLRGFRVFPMALPGPENADQRGAVFRLPDNREIRLEDALVADLLRTVARHRGRLDAVELLDEVPGRHAERFAGMDADSARSQVGGTLIQGYLRNFVDFTLGDLCRRPVRGPAEHPEALPLARWQASQGAKMSSLRLEMFAPDPFVARLIGLCDGSRDVEGLTNAMVEEVVRGELAPPPGINPHTAREALWAEIGRHCASCLATLENRWLLLPRDR